MSPWFHRSLLWLAPLVAAGLTCAFPTDKSDQVVVVVQGSGGVVIRGQELDLVARAFRVIGTDTVEVTNVSFLWSSGNATLATVQDDGGGHAHVTGVNSGTVEITARAVAYEQSDAGSLMVRVANALEVDSVRPRLVKYGDTVTVYGVGVDSIFLASLGGATLLDYPIPFFLPTRSRDSLGYAQATFWVPPPARSARLSYIGPGVFGEAPESTMVLPFDVLEPNESAPREIDVDAPRFPLIPLLSALLFYNPALAFEPLKRDAVGADWYRFSQSTTRDVTLVLGGPGVRGTFYTFLTDTLSFSPADSSYALGPGAWTLGPGSNFCAGMPFEPLQLLPESTIVALHDMPPGVIHSISVYTQAGHYGLRVNEGYGITDPTIPRDDHEEDDFCNPVDARGPTVTVPGASLRDNLTIDNPHDVDWIRFTVAGPSARIVTVSIASVPPTGDDSSDVDLYLLTVPGGGASPSLSEVMRSVKFGSTETITRLLAPGDYYAVVVDYVGLPVRYALCIQAAVACTAFPSPPAVEGGPIKRSPTLLPGPRPAVRR